MGPGTKTGKQQRYPFPGQAAGGGGIWLDAARRGPEIFLRTFGKAASVQLLSFCGSVSGVLRVNVNLYIAALLHRGRTPSSMPQSSLQAT